MSREKENCKEIAEIVPSRKLPRDLTQSFSYEIPEDFKKDIRIGSLVEIPLRKSKIQGIVFSFSSSKKIDFKIKPIHRILEKDYFSEKNIELANFISEYYYCPISWIVKSMTSDLLEGKIRREIKLNDFNIKETEKENIKKIFSVIENEQKSLLFHNLREDRLFLYKKIIKQQSDSSQKLVLFPENFDIYLYGKFFIDNFGKENVSIISGDSTKNQFSDEWKKIVRGEAKIIIGTRQAVMSPFKNLSLIIVDEEHNSSYKQWDQNPRYNARDIAIKMSDIFNSKIILSSPTPSIESFQKTKENFKLIKNTVNEKNRPTIVDMEEERKNGNLSVLSEKLQKNLLGEIYKKKQAIIFVPRIGESTAFWCKDCKYIAHCENCENILVENKGKLFCPKCKNEYEIISKCPVCGGQNIISFGFGSMGIYKEIEKFFTEKNIKISEINNKISENAGKKQTIYKKFAEGKIDVLVGTQTILKNWQNEKIGIICVMFPENILLQNSFRSKERIWQNLYKFYNMPKSVKVIIQTHRRDNALMEEIKNNDFQYFLTRELEDRKNGILKIKYPPFDKIIKFVYKNSDEGTCKKEAEYQYKILKRGIESDNLSKEVELIVPFPAQNYREHGKYRYHIVMRHKKEMTIKNRNIILSKARKNWIIDIDPDDIL